MIRTNTVILSTIKGIAYRLKLTSGGSGIVIMAEGESQPGIASISKTSGKAILTANTPKAYPKEAFEEAIALTAGMPYRKQGSVRLTEDTKLPVDIPDEPIPEETVVDSADYQKIVEHYTDKNGKLSYALINKEMIKFSHSSSIVRKMKEAGETMKAIRLYTVGTKFRGITGNRALTEAEVQKIVSLLDEVSPKGVLKEFNDEIKRGLKKK